MKIYILVPFFLLCGWVTTFSQFYESGQDPASVRWQQINTPVVKLVFPKGMDSAANHLANVFNIIQNAEIKNWPVKPKPITVILHSKSVYANGFVTLAPRRMELFTTPPQQFTAQDWLSELALHEYRHVVQTSNLDQQTTKMLSFFFGEQAPGIAAGFTPRWFLEGDAVYTETLFSNSGRGRNGDFNMEIKALINERNSLFSYEKMLLGSYKHYIPDHYHTGWLLSSGIRNRYGTDIFQNAITLTAQFPIMPGIFNEGIRKETGKTPRKLYSEIFNEQKNTNLRTDFNTTPWKTKSGKIFTSYNFPQPISGNLLFAVKSGLSITRKFIMLDASGKEIKLLSPGIIRDSRISFQNGRIAWTCEIPDPRWANRSYSCLYTFDIQTNQLKQLTSKTRYFGAALADNTNTIATIEITTENKCNLVILNTDNGLKQIIPSPENAILSDPVYSEDKQSIIAVATNNNGKALFSYNTISEKWTQETPFYFYNISSPIEVKSYLIFSADFKGKNEIYAFDNKQQIYQVTHSKYGAFEPVFNAKDTTIIFADYSSQGYKIMSMKWLVNIWEKVTVKSIYNSPEILKCSESERFNLQDSLIYREKNGITDVKYPVKNYHSLLHSFNIHSWSPFYYDYNSLDVGSQYIYPGFSILSQDKLGKTISSLNVVLQNNEWIFKPRLTYKGLLPVFDISMDYGEKTYFVYNDTIYASKIKGLNLSSLIYIPLNFSRLNYVFTFYPLTEITYQNNTYADNSNSLYQGIIKAAPGFTLNFYRHTSVRDLAPRIGFMFGSRYIFTPFDNIQYGWLAYARNRLFLPGLLRHHSLQIYTAAQYQENKNYLFSNQISIARGYTINRAYKTLSLKFDYQFPLVYPDLALGSILYIKRIKSTIFYDCTMNNYKTYYKNGSYIWNTQNMQSAGVDLLADFHVFRMIFPFTAGVRSLYLFNEKVYNIGAIMQLNLDY